MKRSAYFMFATTTLACFGITACSGEGFVSQNSQDNNQQQPSNNQMMASNNQMMMPDKDMGQMMKEPDMKQQQMPDKDMGQMMMQNNQQGQMDMGQMMMPEDMGQMMMEDMGNMIDPNGPNYQWIGGACNSSTDCVFDGAQCLTNGYAGGQCSKSCTRTCPDKDGANSVTFCIDTPTGGQCVSRCDHDLYPGTGCRAGYTCSIKNRFMETSTSQSVCVPPDQVEMGMGSCQEELNAKGIPWTNWAYTTQSAGGKSCPVDTPIKAGPVINGITYRVAWSSSAPSPMRVSCGLALALWDLGEILKTYNIKEVLHLGTFNCRTISGSSKLSQHSFGAAIDISGFVDNNNERYILVDHWEHGTTSPNSQKARVLYEIGQKMHTQKLFNTVLTPNYNAAHDDHFHVDLKTSGGYFIRLDKWEEPYFGNDADKWHEHCGH